MGLTSIILIVLGTVSLQFWGPFVPTSLWSVLRIVAAHVLGTVWSTCSWLFHLAFLVSTSQLTGYGSEYYLSIVLEEELRSLTILKDYIIIVWSSLTVYFFFSHVLTSLIKLILWPKFPQTKDRPRTGGWGNDNRVLLRFRKTVALAIGTFFGKATFLLLIYCLGLSFPHSSVSKESACNARDQGSIPGSERSPGVGNGNPLQ